MGGQACVFYGAAQVSKDVDLALLAEPANIERLRLALKQLAAERIAVPPFDPALFDRGHANWTEDRPFCLKPLMWRCGPSKMRIVSFGSRCAANSKPCALRKPEKNAPPRKQGESVENCPVTIKRPGAATRHFGGFMRRNTPEWGSEAREFQSHRPGHTCDCPQRSSTIFDPASKAAMMCGRRMRNRSSRKPVRQFPSLTQTSLAAASGALAKKKKSSSLLTTAKSSATACLQTVASPALCKPTSRT